MSEGLPLIIVKISLKWYNKDMDMEEHKQENDPQLILPSADEIGVRFGERARSQWEKAGDGQRRGMLKRWQRESVDAAKTTDQGAIHDAVKRASGREAMMEMFALGRSYIMTGEVAMRVRKIGNEAKLKKETDPGNIAQRALHGHMLDSFLRNHSIDFNDIANTARNDPRCAPLDEQTVKAVYLHFIDRLIDAKEIAEDIFDDDEIL